MPVLPDGSPAQRAGVQAPFYWLRLAPPDGRQENFILTNGKATQRRKRCVSTRPARSGHVRQDMLSLLIFFLFACGLVQILAR
jgi:hypothetical protein